MNSDVVERAGDPAYIKDHVKRNAGAVQATMRARGDTMESVREADYRGHHIVIRTTYRIEVDGKPVEGHIMVSDDGFVHFEAIPNSEYTSAVDLVKRIIDVFPAEFARGGSRPLEGGEAHDPARPGDG